MIKNVALVGRFEEGNGANYLAHAFVRNGFHVEKVGIIGNKLWSDQLSLYDRIWNKFGRPVDKNNDNEKLMRIGNDKSVDLVVITKGSHIKPATIEFLLSKNKKLILWTDDNMFIPANSTGNFRKKIKLFDVIVTQKEHNIAQYYQHGAKNVLMFDKAFCELSHRKVLSSDEKFHNDVIFIGHFEKQRADSIQYLIDNGLSVKVFGPGWSRYKKRIKNSDYIEVGTITGEDYCKYITNAKISLCFLRKLAKDSQTGRTMEIPACGGCMVAEWSHEHERLFENSKEAMFFHNDQQLLEVVSDLLHHPNKIDEIKSKGYQRVHADKHSFTNRISKIISYVYENDI